MAIGNGNKPGNTSDQSHNPELSSLLAILVDEPHSAYHVAALAGAGLRSAERGADNFTRKRRVFVLGEFRSWIEWMLQGIMEAMEEGEVTSVTSLDRLFDAMIARNEDRVHSTHQADGSTVVLDLEARSPCI